MSNNLLKMKGISKSFSGVKAVDNVHFEINAGEVHALMGENGAGKSTLMKILCGIYSEDAGEIFINGNLVKIKKPVDAQKLGIIMVHQELNLIKDLTVAQNIFIGREEMQGIFINEKRINELTKELFKKMHMDIDPTAIMSTLTVGKQQMCEIAKAISFDAKLLVFDEPTAALTDSEIDELFKIIKNLKSKGIGVIYITHRMDEVKRITDRITVMRDGKYIGTLTTDETTKDEVIKMMVGRNIFSQKKMISGVQEDAPTVLEVDNITTKKITNVSFNLKKGEILGVAGLMGSGRTELAKAIYGVDKIKSGKVMVKGREVVIKKPKNAVNMGIGYLSEDRKRYGIIVESPVYINATLACLQKFSKLQVLNISQEKKSAVEIIEKLNIKTRGENQVVKTLSGGNQQKVVIGKWIVANSEILIMDEPTRGIDVGAKAEIYELMTELTKQGKSIIMISSDLEEILRMSDRVIVMCEGEKTGELDIDDLKQEVIMKLAIKAE